MGRTYQALNPNDDGTDRDFDVNYAGADLLGCAMKAVDAHSKEIEATSTKYGITDRFPSTAFQMTPAQALNAAKAIRNLSPTQEQAILDQAQGCWRGTPTEFHAFLASWADFLEFGGGYIVMG